MYTVNLATCQSIYDNVNDDNQFLSLVTSSSSSDDGCALLTKLLHAAIQSSDVPAELKTQLAVEAGVL